MTVSTSVWSMEYKWINEWMNESLVTISECKTFLFPCMWHVRLSKNVGTNLVYFSLFYFDLPANFECNILWTVLFRSTTQIKVSVECNILWTVLFRSTTQIKVSVECNILWTVLFRSTTQIKVSVECNILWTVLFRSTTQIKVSVECNILWTVLFRSTTQIKVSVEFNILWTVLFRSTTQIKVSVMAVVFQVHICSSVSRLLLKISNVILIFFPPSSPMTVSKFYMYVMARILHPDLVYHWLLLGILTRMVMGVSTKKFTMFRKGSWWKECKHI